MRNGIFGSFCLKKSIIMKSICSITLALFLITTGAGLKAQLKSDIGIRLSQVNGGRWQLEFRKPLNAFYNLRLGASSGYFYSTEDYGSELILSDSIKVRKRNRLYISQKFDIRCGVERKLKWDLFSVHA